MSENSEIHEGTSFRSSIIMSKISRTKDEELVIKINSLRFQLRQYVQKIIELIHNNINKEQKTIHIKEINKIITYEDDILLDRLIHHLNEIINTKQLIPELSYSSRANFLFNKTVGTHIDHYKGILGRTKEIDEKLYKTFPSKLYQGLYIPDIELVDIDKILIMIIIQEFIILSKQSNDNHHDHIRQNIKIDYYDHEQPQIISLLNPYFSSVLVYLSEIKANINGTNGTGANITSIETTNTVEGKTSRGANLKAQASINTGESGTSMSSGGNTTKGNNSKYNIYILFLSEAFEANQDIHSSNHLYTPFLNSNSPRYDNNFEMSTGNHGSKTLTDKEQYDNSPIPKKYNNLSMHKPDVNLDLIEKFIRKIDHDADDKLSPEDIIQLVRVNNLVFTDEQIYNMFEEIYNKRTVVFESQRKAPVDVKELYSAIRYKYKKVGNELVTEARPYRDTWLLMMKKAGFEPTKNPLPPIKIEPIRALYESESQLRLPKINHLTQSVTIHDLKKPAYIQAYAPEGGILIQNTPNIEEVYIEKEIPREDPLNQEAFRVIVNSKIKDITQNDQYQTIKFDTKEYYNEALRLSKIPTDYLYEKNNPIHRFLPAKEDFIPEKLTRERTVLQMLPSRSMSKLDYIDSEFECFSVSNLDPGKDFIDETNKLLSGPYKRGYSRASNKGIKWGYTSLKVLDKPENIDFIDNHGEQLSKQQEQQQKKMFNTTFKLVDVRTLKAQTAKEEPVIDLYVQPHLPKFRDDHAPENKPLFKITRVRESKYIQEPDKVDLNNSTDQLVKESIMKEKLEEEKSRQKIKQWIYFLKRAPKGTTLSEHKYPESYQREPYDNPLNSIRNLLRDENEFPIPFKLFHRGLKRTDKGKFFGDLMPSKMQKQNKILL